MKVRITKRGTTSTSWYYSSEVGNEFEVEDYDFFTYKLISGSWWIQKTDCEIIMSKVEQIERALAENSEDYDIKVIKLITLARAQEAKIAEQNKKLEYFEGLVEEYREVIDTLQPAKPHWRETVSKENPVLCYVRDSIKCGWSAMPAVITHINKESSHRFQTEFSSWSWKFAKRAPVEMIDKLRAGYDETSSEDE